MTQPNHKLVDRIDERLQALGLTDRKASMNAVGKPDLVRYIRRGVEVGTGRLSSLADVLGCSLDYLLGKTDLLTDEAAAQPVPPRQQMHRDLPVFGTAIGATADLYSEDRRVAVEQTFIDSSDVIDYFRRPPKLSNRQDVYGLYIVGDSMEPAYESGEGIICDPKKPPPRDYVVVYMRGDDDRVSAVLVKRLVRRSGTFIELEQYNPPARFQIALTDVKAVHRVIPWDEAFGF
jgi:phage repressor protein C with HTH and peptisase S24 domain